MSALVFFPSGAKKQEGQGIRQRDDQPKTCKRLAEQERLEINEDFLGALKAEKSCPINEELFTY